MVCQVMRHLVMYEKKTSNTYILIYIDHYLSREFCVLTNTYITTVYTCIIMY